MNAKRGRWRIGDIAKVDLGDGSHCYAWVLNSVLVGFWGIQATKELPLDDLVHRDFIFKLLVMRKALTSGRWPVIGNVQPDAELQLSPKFFRQDAITGELFISQNGNERPATRAECEGLECLAVWSANHVEDRLRDHFSGRPDKWFESMRIRERK